MVAASLAAAVTVLSAPTTHIERKSLGQDRGPTYALLLATGLALPTLRLHIRLGDDPLAQLAARAPAR
jgi:hypothetical protein